MSEIKGNVDASLCWFCQRAVPGNKMCQWALSEKPIEGWTAVLNEKNIGKHKSYFVTDCPLFFPDEKLYAAVYYSMDFKQFEKLTKQQYGSMPSIRRRHVYTMIRGHMKKYENTSLRPERGLKYLKVGIVSDTYKPPEKEACVKRIESTEKAYNVLNAPRANRIIRLKNGEKWKVRYRRALSREHCCIMNDCIYSGSLTGLYESGSLAKRKATHFCNYCLITGHLRSVRKKKKVNQIVDGKCPLYKPGKRLKRNKKALSVAERLGS